MISMQRCPKLLLPPHHKYHSSTTRMSHSISFWIESRFNFTASYSQKRVAIRKRRVSYELTGCRCTSGLNVRASGCNLRSPSTKGVELPPQGRRPPNPHSGPHV